MSPALEILNARLPVVAIVGRPNVGKSTLFNRIVGRRKAVVLETAGMTRDRNFETAEWNGRAFSIVDTGGYESNPRDSIYEKMRGQCLLAIQEADVALFLADVLEPDNPVDRDVADLLRRSGKPVVIAVNKCDNTRRFQEAAAFYALGFEDLFPVSALNGGGTGDLLDRVVAQLPPPAENAAEFRAREGIRIAVIGRPNVGKSSLVNAILGQERVIVSEIPGTTRDAIDTTFRVNAPSGNENESPEERAEEAFEEALDESSAENRGRRQDAGETCRQDAGATSRERIYTLIDTAGLRRRGKIERGMEMLSIFSAEASLRRCDVALVLIDAADGLTDQDKHVAGYAHEAHRACILIVNKWDLPEKDNATAGAFVKKLRDEMGFLRYAPVLLVSAKTGQRVHRVLDLVDKVYAEFRKEIPTPALNEWLAETTRRLSPPFHKGRQLSIKYATQVRACPPTFAFFVNSPEAIHFSYQRYLSNRLRECFGFEGTAIRLIFRRKTRRKGIEN